jgi:hypothetical protein
MAGDALTQPTRQDNYDVTVSIVYGGTTKDLGTFDSFSGGEVDSEETKYYPGAMQEPVSLGGRKSVGNVTVGREYDVTRDHPIMGWLFGGAGKADVTVTKTLMNVDAVAQPAPLVYHGKLKTVTPPDHDSESNDAGVFTLEISSATVAQTS